MRGALPQPAGGSGRSRRSARAEPAAAAGERPLLLDAVERDLQEAVAEADRLDPHWRLEEIEANRIKIPDDRNSTLQVMKVRSLLPKGWDTTQADVLLQNLAPELQLKPLESAAVRNALANVQPALAVEAMFHRLRLAPAGR